VVTAEAVRAAARTLEGIAVRTSLVELPDMGVYLKLETEQPVGAFKLRGAYNAIKNLPDAARRRGVITFSSGNHGQAVAYAAKLMGVRAVVTMPETAPAIKVNGVKQWGGEVVFAGRTSEDRRVKALEIAAREGLAVVPPKFHAHLLALQSRVYLQLQRFDEEVFLDVWVLVHRLSLNYATIGLRMGPTILRFLQKSRASLDISHTD